MLDLAPASDSPNLVLINVSPIEYGHVLLCPRVLDDQPQVCGSVFAGPCLFVACTLFAALPAGRGPVGLCCCVLMGVHSVIVF